MAAEALFTRSKGNPILKPESWPYTVNAVMNPGAAVVDGETVLLCRVEDCRGMSHLTVARSGDGISNWVVDKEPLLAPDGAVPAESWGLEDPRITPVDEFGFVICYTSFGPGGPSVSLATTEDFRTVKRLGTVMAPEDKNGALLPRRVHGKWVLFHRPISTMNNRADIWLSRSADLVSWSSPEVVLTTRDGSWWDSARIGMGPPPVETEEGWLVVYHGVKVTVAGALYRMGLALLDIENPSRVLRRAEEWAMGPQAGYELVGDVPGVVFPCGLIHDAETGQLRVYYGAADTSIGLATADLADVLDLLRESPSA